MKFWLYFSCFVYCGFWGRKITVVNRDWGNQGKLNRSFIIIDWFICHREYWVHYSKTYNIKHYLCGQNEIIICFKNYKTKYRHFKNNAKNRIAVINQSIEKKWPSAISDTQSYWNSWLSIKFHWHYHEAGNVKNPSLFHIKHLISDV